MLAVEVVVEIERRWWAEDTRETRDMLMVVGQLWGLIYTEAGEFRLIQVNLEVVDHTW